MIATRSSFLAVAIAWTVAIASATHAFVRPSPTRQTRRQPFSSSSTSSSATLLLFSTTSNLVVVSPPGGVGEVTAVKAASLGAKVRWFVVSNNSNDDNSNNDKSKNVVQPLAPQALQDIQSASGALELAGATVDELKAGGDALAAVAEWCSAVGANGLVCTYDDDGGRSTVDGTTTTSSSTKKRVNPETKQNLAAAVRLAAREAAKSIQGGPRVAVLSAEEDLDLEAMRTGDVEGAGGGEKSSGLLGSLFGNAVTIPTSLPQALASSSPSSEVCIVRHGELFGMPESSPDFSPLVGGPKRQPVVAEEYTMRNVRVDPFVVSGNIMSASSTSRTCRQSLGEAAALLATGKLPTLSQPISISSQVGTDEFTLEQWEQEMNRIKELVASGQASTLFRQEMTVDDTERLADWLTTKWAPAVLRTYDIAAIRIGARPVYATRPTGKGDGLVEITWQELINFDSVTVGKMILQVTSDGIRATRGGGDASKGFGAVSPLPLNGEDVLVRRLAEAASQAVEKGLAKKIPMKKSSKVAVQAPVPVTSLQSAGDVEPQAAVATIVAPPKQETAPTPQTGPRQAGARRSTPRSRGTGKKAD